MKEKISKNLGSINSTAVPILSTSSSKKNLSSNASDFKKHDEQMKQIKEMIKSKVGH
jgi:hypothetical protein